jgi:hypothetical protein
MKSAIVTLLCCAAVFGAFAAMIIYAVQVAIRPRWIRLANGAGLFFTGLALAESAMLMPRLASGSVFGAVLVTAALLVAVYFQSAAGLRGRSADPRKSA